MVQPTAPSTEGFAGGSAVTANEPLSNVLRLIYTSNFNDRFQIRLVCFTKKEK
jgi:hypothetical protein